MTAPAMKTLRVSLVDLEITPAGPGGTMQGEVWAKLSQQVRTTDGQVVVLAAPRRVVDSTGIVDFQVPANDDAGIMLADQGFGVVIGWDLTSRGSRGSTVNDCNPGTGILVTSADPSVTMFADKAPASPTGMQTVYSTAPGPAGPPGADSTVPGPYGGTVVTDPAIAALVNTSGSDTDVALRSTYARIVTPEQFGAVGNGRELAGGTITSGALGTLVDTTNSPFTTASVGMAIMVYGAGAAGVPLVTTIATRVSATTVTLTTAASTAVAGAVYRFGTDDTAAILAAQDAVCPGGVGSGTVQFGDKIYVLATAPRHDRSGNAIIALPYNPITTLPSHPGNLHLMGVADQLIGQGRMDGVPNGTVLMPILPAQAYSGTYGPPSIIGGPTLEQLGTGYKFTVMTPVVENILLWVPPDPTLAGIDFGLCANAKVLGSCVTSVVIGQTDVAQPTHVWSFGIRMPGAGNSGVSVVDALVAGFYLGLTGDDHLDLRGLIVNRCWIGYAPSSLGTMPTIANKLQSQECKYHIAGWTVTAGLAEIPPGTMVNLQNLKLEDDNASWRTSPVHVYDPTNHLTGIIVTNISPLIFTGALKVNFKAINTGGQSKIGAQYVIDCTAIPYGMVSGSFTVVFDAATWHSCRMQNTSGVGSYMGWAVDLDAGTYDVSIYTMDHSYGGQATLTVDGVSVIATFDTYAATTAAAVHGSASGGVVFGQGVSTLQVDVTGKNASSASYMICLTKIILQRIS